MFNRVTKVYLSWLLAFLFMFSVNVLAAEKTKIEKIKIEKTKVQTNDITLDLVDADDEPKINTIQLPKASEIKNVKKQASTNRPPKKRGHGREERDERDASPDRPNIDREFEDRDKDNDSD